MLNDTISPTAVFASLANEFTGDVAAFVRLDEDEASALLRQVLAEVEARDVHDAADRIAASMRALVGLTAGETETANRLTPAEADRWDSICAAASR